MLGLVLALVPRLPLFALGLGLTLGLVLGLAAIGALYQDAGTIGAGVGVGTGTLVKLPRLTHLGIGGDSPLLQGQP